MVVLGGGGGGDCRLTHTPSTRHTTVILGLPRKGCREKNFTESAPARRAGDGHDDECRRPLATDSESRTARSKAELEVLVLSLGAGNQQQLYVEDHRGPWEGWGLKSPGSRRDGGVG